jgi:hypothetical protein
LFLAVSFLASSSVDYSGILHNIGGRIGARSMVSPPVETESYTTLDPEAKG